MTNEQHLAWWNKNGHSWYPTTSHECLFCNLPGLRWKEFYSPFSEKSRTMRLVLVSGEPHVCKEYLELKVEREDEDGPHPQAELCP